MTKRLKIGVLIDQLLTGGVQIAAIEQVKEFNKLGHSAKLLILMRKKYSTGFSHLIKDVPHQYLSDSYPQLFQKTIKFPIFSFLSTSHLLSPFLAPWAIKKNQYDILISHGTTICLTAEAVYRKLNIPYIAIIHDPIVYILEKVYSQTFLQYLFPIIKPIASCFERSFVKNAASTVIDSTLHYLNLKKNYQIIPNIIRLGTQTLHKLPQKRGSYVLSFGRWQKEKNPEFLLKLIKLLPGKLIIAGNWSNNKDLDWFKEKVKEGGLQKKIEIIPSYSDKMLHTVCEKARLFVYPHPEAFGLSALEAASHGLPVIMPKKSGITESFTHGVHGFFPKKIDLKEYKNYVEAFVNNERLAYKMGKAAWEQAKREFSWQVHTKKLLNLINLALHSNQKQTLVVLETAHVKGPALAGGDRLMEPMVKNLIDKFKFIIISSSFDGLHWQKAGFNNEIHTLSKNIFDRFISPIPILMSYLVRSYQSFRLLRALNSYDIVYSSTDVLPDTLPSFLIKKVRPKVFWIARIHHLVEHPLRRPGGLLVNISSYVIQRLMFFLIKNQADKIIALNHRLKKELISLGFPNKKLFVLNAGIDYQKIQSAKILKAVPLFDGVFLGRLHPSKGIFDLVPIWQEVVKKVPSAKLGIIGTTTDKKLLETLTKSIQKNHLSKNIILTGFLNDEKVYSVLKKAKVFLFTDHEAGFGLAITQAMACGLPVVGWDIGILGKVYKHGFIKIPKDNFRSFGEVLTRLLGGGTLRNHLSKAAQAESAHFDWSKTSKVFSSILTQKKLI